MEQFYYLSEEFLKARFNISELHIYVLVEYTEGEKSFLSFGRMIESRWKQNMMFIDLRRGRICTPYTGKLKNRCCKVKAIVKVTFGKNNRDIIITDKNGKKVLQLDYSEIEKLYKDSWFTTAEIRENPPCPELNPFGSKKFYARHFNVECKRLTPRIIYYTQGNFSLGYEYKDGLGSIFLIDIFKDKILEYDKEKITLFKTVQKDLFNLCGYLRKPAYFVDSKEKSEVDAEEPLVEINFLQSEIDRIYRTSWYTKIITRHGWREYRQFVFTKE